MVNVPSSLTASGRRERHYHKTRDLAKEHASELREKHAEHGSGHSVIPPSLAEDAARAKEILRPWGLSLTDAAKSVAATLTKRDASKPIEEAAEAWLKGMEGLRERSVKSYEVTLRRLVKALPGRLLSTLDAQELASAGRPSGVAAATYALHRRNLRAFWYWCAKRGWCDKAVFEGVETPRRGDDREIEFLTAAEAAGLLRVAEEASPRAVPMYALALFAGIRAEELHRLQAQHVTEAGINLPADVTKKGRRRHIQPSETLMSWLAAYPFHPCPNWKQVDCAVRRLAGWNVAASLLECPPEPTRGRWPQNALRHSHATYAVAAGVPLESLLFEFGHVGGIETLRRHYVGRATKAEAEAFFSLRPIVANPPS